MSYSTCGDTGLHEGEEGEDHTFPVGMQRRVAPTKGLAVAAAEVSTIRLSEAARESWESAGEQSSLSALRLRWLRGSSWARSSMLGDGKRDRRVARYISKGWPETHGAERLRKRGRMRRSARGFFGLCFACSHALTSLILFP